MQTFAKNGVTHTCEYDSNGIRYKKTANGLQHEYYLEDNKIVREVVKGANNYELQYMYGANGIVGFAYKKNGSTSTYYYRKNILGDIIEIYGTNGTKYAEYAYDAWGNCTVLENNSGIATLNPFRYRGYYWDSEFGLYYLNARYYDPEVGRFISQDSIKYLDPETLNGLNLFAYCLNNPVMGYDPDGTWSWKSIGKIFAAISIFFVAAVVTIATAGTAVGVIATGALVGGVVGASVGGISSAIEANREGRDISEAFADGFLLGAITGTISGSVAATSIGIAGQIFVNSCLGVGQYLTESLIHNEPLDLSKLSLSVCSGVFAGLCGGAGVLKTSGNTLTKIILQREIIRNAVKHVFSPIMKSAAGGIIPSFFDWVNGRIKGD